MLYVCIKYTLVFIHTHIISIYAHMFICTHTHIYLYTFLVAQTVKNLPAMQETQVRSLGQEDPLEKGMAIHSNILAWRIPWIEEPGGPQFIGLRRVRHD